MKTFITRHIKKHDPISFVDVAVTHSYMDQNVCGLRLVLDTDVGMFAAEGSARRNPVDDENPELAQTLAIARALESLANGLHKRARGFMKQQDEILTAKGEARLKAAAKRVQEKEAITAFFEAEPVEITMPEPTPEPVKARRLRRK